MDANTSQRKWWIPCCDNEECPECKGNIRVYPERCPIHYYDSEIKTLRFLYECYNDKNILPFSGSPIEQPKVLFKYFDLIDHYLWLIRESKNRAVQANEDVTARIMKGKNG